MKSQADMPKSGATFLRFNHPVRFFSTLLAIIAVLELAIMYLLPVIVPKSLDYLENIVDTVLLSSLSAPFIWYLIVVPLKNISATEIARTKAALGNVADAVINFDTQGRIESLNTGAVVMFGYGADEITGQDMTKLIPGFNINVMPVFECETRNNGPVWGVSKETTGCRKDGTCFDLEVSISKVCLFKQTIFIAIARDITERKRYEEQLEYKANYDDLTRLPNRNLLTDRFQQALIMARRHQGEVAIILVDLDNFKFINDSLGHDYGDVLLQKIAARITCCVRSSDTVAHQGGDEFIVLISNQNLSENVDSIAAKILQSVAQPVQLDEHEIIVTCSAGISIFPKDGEDTQTLIKNADVALYRAKEQGRNAYSFFTGEMNAKALARMTMEKHLRRALERDELMVYYQPKVSLLTGAITGMEALLRWKNPELGMVSPGSFIPLAEETGLIDEIGEMALLSACAQNKAWHDAGLPRLTVAVNLSVRQLIKQNIVGLVRHILNKTGLDPKYLEIEITESMLASSAENVESLLGELKRLGVCLTIDDFGTGYSNLGYIAHFPFDKLKIDQSFVRNIIEDKGNATVVRAIMAMSRSLDLKVVVEGVETREQLDYMRSQKCDEMQGFYFSRPIPAEEFEALLREGRHLDFSDPVIN